MRFGQVIKLKPDRINEYVELHAAVWPAVKAKIEECNIRNYSIYLKGETLFAYFEYVGADFDVDMTKMAADPTTQKWWDVCKPCQKPIDSRKEGEWWANMEEIFHQD